MADEVVEATEEHKKAEVALKQAEKTLATAQKTVAEGTSELEKSTDEVLASAIELAAARAVSEAKLVAVGGMPGDAKETDSRDASAPGSVAETLRPPQPEAKETAAENPRSEKQTAELPSRGKIS